MIVTTILTLKTYFCNAKTGYVKAQTLLINNDPSTSRILLKYISHSRNTNWLLVVYTLSFVRFYGIWRGQALTLRLQHWSAIMWAYHLPWYVSSMTSVSWWNLTQCSSLRSLTSGVTQIASLRSLKPLSRRSCRCESLPGHCTDGVSANPASGTQGHLKSYLRIHSAPVKQCCLSSFQIWDTENTRVAAEQKKLWSESMKVSLLYLDVVLTLIR